MSTNRKPDETGEEHKHGPGCQHGHHDHLHAAQPARNTLRGVGRNDPCPCGSGRKFKKCHGAA